MTPAGGSGARTPSGKPRSATGTPPGARTVLVIHNPTAGRRRRAHCAEAVRYLERQVLLKQLNASLHMPTTAIHAAWITIGIRPGCIR
ncbi:MAG: hypothetical protein ABFS30_14580 [Pseudomonadota bacterium]